MKVIAIIGTGVKDGTISKMCQAILSGANDRGYQTEMVYLSDYSISACRGCFKCLGDSNCIIQDDFHKVYRSCAESDVIILGTPVYMGNISGLMKNFFDRHNGDAMFNPPLMAKLKDMPSNERMRTFFSQISKVYKPKAEIQGKRIIRVVSANKPYLLLSLFGELRTTYAALSMYIKEMRCKLHGSILYCGTQFKPEKEIKILNRAYDMGKHL